jgi:hypothetical protein
MRVRIDSSALRAVAIIAVTSIVGIAPALLHGQPASDSGVYDQVWTSQFAEALARGELYPRWLPRSFGGAGAPTFYFYPPLVFYLTSAIRLAGASLETSITVAEGLLLFLSGCTMLAWLRRRGLAWSTFWACAYAVAPYHLLDLHTRGDIAELGAFVWLPLIALGVEEARWRLTALSYAGLICTHLPMALLAGVFLVLPLSLFDRRRLARALVGCAIGVAASAIYVLPALTLQRFISLQVLLTPYYTAANWSVLNPQGHADRLLLAGFAAMAIAGIPAVVLAKPRREWVIVLVLTAVAGLGILPIWSLPVLRDIQFPWRLFGVFEFAVIAALAEWRSQRPRWLALVALVVAAFPGAWLVTVTATPAYKSAPSEVDIASGDDAFEYLPAGANLGDVDRLRRWDGRSLPASNRRAEIAQAAAPVEVAGLTISLAALALIALWRGKRQTPDVRGEKRVTGSAPAAVASSD